MVCGTCMAQTDTLKYATVTGKVMLSDSGGTASGILISIPRLKLMTVTSDSGVFVFKDIKYGFCQLIIDQGYGKKDTLDFRVGREFVDLGTWVVADRNINQLPLMEAETTDSLAYDKFPDAGTDGPFITSLAAHHNTYSAATVRLSSLQFRPRGYSGQQTEVNASGVFMNNVKTGTPFGVSSLHGAFRNNETFPGLQRSDIGAGFLNGYVQLDWVASHQERQTILSYTHSNGNYSNRLLVGHHTGWLNNGWAFSFAGGSAGAGKGYIEGTYNQQYAYYIGISRKIGQKSGLHFFTLTGKDIVARPTPATQEAYDLAGSGFYNPSWGYQNGSVRSANIAKTFLPLYAIQYEYNRNTNTHFDLTFASQYGYSQQSALDWYDAADPRPDYYRKMPSYYTNDPATANEDMAEKVKQKWLSNADIRHINWEQLYEVNRMHYDEVNGVAGYRSAYTLGIDREDVRKYMLAQSFRKKCSEHLKISAGFSFILQQSENYREMSDLLGGDYYVDLNPFAEQMYAGSASLKQADLNHPDRIIRVGDRYGYDYKSIFIKSFAWANIYYERNRYDFFVTAKFGYDQFSRQGIYRNGSFPDNSYGTSATPYFVTCQFKGGFTWKINGFHNTFVHALLMSRPPAMDDIFISPKTRNVIATEPSTEKTVSIEAGYLFRHATWNGSITVFASDTKDVTDIRRFYYESDNTFVNYLMQHMGIRHQGAELAVQVKILPSLVATASATWMQVFYTSNPNGSLYRDNDTTNVVKHHVAYLKNYYVASGPQSAATLGFLYSAGHGFNAGVHLNFTDRNYVAINPMRHTEEAVDMLRSGSVQQDLVLRQEKLPAAFTLDLSAGKTFAIHKMMKWLPYQTSLRINAGIINILNRKDIRTSGYDQLRFDYDTKNPEIFPAKYTYGYGVTYYVSCKIVF